ncbi:MAG: alanine dehydrogenase [Bacillota bacterium]|jgi:alanine dehydrogenase
MKLGVPREIKSNENRVALTPAGASVLTGDGHDVFIERGAGEGSGFPDDQYTAVGATILPDPASVFGEAEMIMKVKEPLEPEFELMRPGQVLFTYLHLAAEETLTHVLLDRQVVSIAYETVELEDGSLPLLTPMSEVAGRMATQVGAQILEKHQGGKGTLLGGIPGVPPARVVIVGGGVVGTNAAKIAVGFGARVSILDIDAARLRYLNDIFGSVLETCVSNPYVIAEAVAGADLLIGAVLVKGARAPKLVTADMVSSMEDGSVIVDVAIDQGGSVETIDRVTTHADPTYVSHGVVHYSVANMPGAVPRTSTLGLTNVTLPYARALAGKGWERALAEDPALAKGLNVVGGEVVYEAVAEAHGLPYSEVSF